METSSQQIRVQAARLTRYCRRAKDKIWNGSRQDLIDALADIAETNEISRRLYTILETFLKNSPR